MQEYVRSPQIEGERFDEAGLSGAELELKLNRVRYARGRYQASEGRQKFRWGLRLLQRINVPLKSLISVVGAGEALGEFKETLELDLADRLDPDAVGE